MFNIYTRVRCEKDSQWLWGTVSLRLQKFTLLELTGITEAGSYRVYTGLEIFEVFTYFSYMCNGRKRLYHIFVNDLVNDKRMRLGAANPNYWLMLKIANSTYFLSSQLH